MIIKFNTGRQYSDNGQEIIAHLDGQCGIVRFADYTRMINGTFKARNVETKKQLQELTMFMYDSGEYESGMWADAHELKDMFVGFTY